jgi:DNA-binding NarL/FixJ family response regulator
MHKVKILIAGNHELVRQDVRAVLWSERNAQIVGETTTGARVVEQVKKLKPDIVILDPTLPGLHGVETTHRIHAVNPRAFVLILSVNNPDAKIRKTLETDAHGLVVKSDLASKLQAALTVVRGGRHELSEKHSTRSTKKSGSSDWPSSFALTSRELEVARLLSLGKSSKEIASELKVSARTVETHRANIMRKFNVHTVTELLHRAFTHRVMQTSSETDNRLE